jgi:hypothetical protein
LNHLERDQAEGQPYIIYQRQGKKHRARSSSSSLKSHLTRSLMTRNGSSSSYNANVDAVEKLCAILGVQIYLATKRVF